MGWCRGSDRSTIARWSWWSGTCGGRGSQRERQGAESSGRGGEELGAKMLGCSSHRCAAHFPFTQRGNEFAVRSANAGHASIQPAPSETRDCQSGISLLNFLESGFHGHSGSGEIALHMGEQIAVLVILIDGEFSR